MDVFHSDSFTNLFNVLGTYYLSFEIIIRRWWISEFFPVMMSVGIGMVLAALLFPKYSPKAVHGGAQQAPESV